MELQLSSAAEEEIQLTLGREWRHREARSGDAADNGRKGGEREIEREREGERRRVEHVVREGEQSGGEVRAWLSYAPGARAYVHIRGASAVSHAE